MQVSGEPLLPEALPPRMPAEHGFVQRPGALQLSPEVRQEGRLRRRVPPLGHLRTGPRRRVGNATATTLLQL